MKVTDNRGYEENSVMAADAIYLHENRDVRRTSGGGAKDVNTVPVLFTGLI